MALKLWPYFSLFRCCCCVIFSSGCFFEGVLGLWRMTFVSVVHCPAGGDVEPQVAYVAPVARTPTTTSPSTGDALPDLPFALCRSQYWSFYFFTGSCLKVFTFRMIHVVFV